MVLYDPDAPPLVACTIEANFRSSTLESAAVVASAISDAVGKEGGNVDGVPGGEEAGGPAEK